MSNYRDDEVSGAVVSETYTARWGMILQDAAITATVMALAIGGTFSDSAIASDEFQDHVTAASQDSIVATEQWITVGALRSWVTESATSGDSLRVSVLQQVTDSATADDALDDRRSGRMVESATASDLFTGVKHSARQITENAKAGDSYLTITRQQITDSATASDSVISVSVVQDRFEEYALASDSLNESSQHIAHIFDVAIPSDEVKHHLSAKYQWTDTIYLEDSLQGDGTGAAWTANVNGYATSRYSPYNFSSIAVVNGILYGTRPDGVYRLDGVGSSEIVTAVMKTAKMDLSGDTLCYPNSVYLSYKTDGVVTLNVETSQSGQLVDYDYSLPAELSDEITTGRITLGRGLRGRYYSFTLTTEATYFSAVEMLAKLDKSTRRI